MMGITALTTAVTVFILRLHHQDKQSTPPKWLTSLVYKWIRPAMFPNCTVPKNTQHPLDNKFQNPKDILYSTPENYAYAYSSRYSDETQCITTVDEPEKETESPKIEQSNAQWKDLANILDSFFFVLFLILTIAISIIILIVVPITKRNIT